MTSYNKTILLGNLTHDPSVRYTPDGTAVATFALAVNRKIKGNNGVTEEVSYIDIVVFGKQAENAGQYLHKGDGALIEGRLQQRRWVGRDGTNKSRLEVFAQAVTYMPKRSHSEQRTPNSEHASPGGVPPEVAQTFPEAEATSEDQIPF